MMEETRCAYCIRLSSACDSCFTIYEGYLVRKRVEELEEALKTAIQDLEDHQHMEHCDGCLYELYGDCPCRACDFKKHNKSMQESADKLRAILEKK